MFTRLFLNRPPLLHNTGGGLILGAITARSQRNEQAALYGDYKKLIDHQEIKTRHNLALRGYKRRCKCVYARQSLETIDGAQKRLYHQNCQTNRILALVSGAPDYVYDNQQDWTQKLNVDMAQESHILGARKIQNATNGDSIEV